MAEPAAPVVAELLEWDSAFFGRRIGRATVHRLDGPTAAELLEWCQSSHIDCLYFLADADDAATTRVAEQIDFRLVDIRVTLQVWLKPPYLSPPDTGPVIGLAQPADLPALQQIAADGHRDTRFYFDGNFPVERCDDLYRTWMRRSCEGYADAVLVARDHAQVAGYITCHRDAGESGHIGLVGVGNDFRGQGIGSALVRASLSWFADQGRPQVQVVTQGRNVTAQRLYQQQGFRTSAIQLWYHYWLASSQPLQHS